MLRLVDDDGDGWIVSDKDGRCTTGGDPRADALSVNVDHDCLTGRQSFDRRYEVGFEKL